MLTPEEILSVVGRETFTHSDGCDCDLKMEKGYMNNDCIPLFLDSVDKRQKRIQILISLVKREQQKAMEEVWSSLI